jgi:hypothetical protein
MIRLRALLIVFILVCPCTLLAQVTEFTNDYEQADSLALATKYQGDINVLTKQLTTPFKDPVLKARAIFRWITANIAYDYKYFNRTEFKGREPKGFECSGDSADCAVKQRVWETQYVLKVLNKGKGVCQGYAMLFKTMCGIAGIEAEVVPGYVRTEFYEIGTAGNLDHAWNVVLLKGSYYLLDPTWASGGCAKDDEGKMLAFQRHFNNYYWLAPADEFARDHFPEDPKWVLIHKYTKDNFSANPYYAPEVISYIKLLAPQSGIISAKKGDTLRFRLQYAGEFNNLQINTNIFQNPDIWTWEYITNKKMIKVPDTIAIKKQQYIKYEKIGDNYLFTYVVKDRSLEYLDILFDRHRVMRFKVRVHS